MSIFERIKILSEKRDKSLQEVAEELNFSKNIFYKWKTSDPKAVDLERVADYFDVTVDYLLGRNETPEWADGDDMVALDKTLNRNVRMSYMGEELTPEEIERLREIVTVIFWEKRAKKRKKKDGK